MPKLTHQEWQDGYSEIAQRHSALIIARRNKLAEVGELYSQIEKLSEQIIECEQQMAQLQWSRPKPAKGEA